MPSNKRIAVWMSEKKLKKLNWDEFSSTCERYGFDVFQLDLSRSIKEQGPFCILLHKLTDIIAAANQGDVSNSEILHEVEGYLAQHPNIAVLDPIPNVRCLLDRCNCYSLIKSSNLHNCGVFTPNFCVIRTNDLDVMKEQLKNSSVTFPLICKPLLGHGSRKAHEMSIIFNEEYLLDCRTPCVVQSFINHNAILYKIFIVGDKFHYVERPSLKNFYTSHRESIHFHSSDVSKADSRSRLSVLDPKDVNNISIKPDPKIMEVIATTLRELFGMDLLGIDVVIETSTGRYGIIDVNAYPGFDGFPNFYEALLDCISAKVTSD